MVLVSYVIHILCLRERCAAERRSRGGLVSVQRDIIETERTAALRRYLHAVLVFQTIYVKRLLCIISCIISSKSNNKSTYHGVVHRYLGSRIAACCEHHLHLSLVRSTLTGNCIGLVRTKVYRSILVKVASSTEPCVVVYFVQGVIVVCFRIVLGQEFLSADTQRGFVRLRDEVIPIVRIRITHANVTTVPRYRSLCIEKSSAVNSTCWHLLEVVEGFKFFAHKFLVLQRTAITINLHLVETRESCTLNHGIGKLMDARLAHSDLCPVSCRKHRSLSVTLGGG